ncbi:MAG: hypothetical protein IPO60_08105, partial [Flavobacteriales bacterium]|nr:hypothetical protein [Flavobacteriales bacterium]
MELPENVGRAGGQRHMNAAIGEYIVRMDADDTAVPERIALQTAFMDAHPEVGASGGAISAALRYRISRGSFPLTVDRCAAELRSSVYRWPSPLHPSAQCLWRNCFISTSRLARASGRLKLAWLRMAPHTRFANFAEVLVRYRRNTEHRP